MKFIAFLHRYVSGLVVTTFLLFFLLGVYVLFGAGLKVLPLLLCLGFLVFTLFSLIACIVDLIRRQ